MDRADLITTLATCDQILQGISDDDQDLIQRGRRFVLDWVQNSGGDKWALKATILAIRALAIDLLNPDEDDDDT